MSNPPNPPTSPTPPPSGQQTTQQTAGGQQTVDQTKQTQTPLNVQEMQLEIASLKKLVADNASAQTDADTQQQQQVDTKEQTKEIEALTSQLKEVYVGIISGTNLYKADELSKMDINDLRSISHTVQRLNEQLAKEGKNLPSSTQLGLPDNLQGNLPNSSTEFKEPFQYDPKTGTWKGLETK